MEKKKIFTEQRMEHKDVVYYLENLLDAFKSGCIEVRHRENQILLAPSSNINVEIEAKQKPDKESFSLELSWNPCAVCRNDEDRLSIRAFAAEEDGRTEKDEQDGKTADGAASAAMPVPPAPAGEKKLSDDIKSADAKNRK